MPPRSRHRFWDVLTGISLFTSACGGSPTETVLAGSVSVSPDSASFDAVGQTQQLSATATDESGAALPSPRVTWSSSNPSVATVTGNGLVSAAGNGSASIKASVGGVSGTATVIVALTPAQLQKVAGDQQDANIGQAVPTPLTVEITDATGHPIQGITVGFTVAPGLGTLGSPTSVTGADGRASSTLKVLGSGPIDVGATVANTTLSTTFTATGFSPFQVELRFLTTPTPAQQEAFLAAQLRWQGLIVGDVPDIPINVSAGTCGSDSPALNRTIDDVLILVTLQPIDGAGGVLGQAAPCLVRSAGDIPVMGFMQFDTADLDVLQSNGLLSAVILHEMGHVLGFGTIWTDPGINLLADPSLPPANGADPHFIGVQAIAAFQAADGQSDTPVPVENAGGVGTADSHWRESVFGNELMTGFLDGGINPLSRVSVASMADLGYTVNLDGADAFSLALPPGLRAFARGPKVALVNDVVRLPIRVVNSHGQVERIVQP